MQNFLHFQVEMNFRKEDNLQEKRTHLSFYLANSRLITAQLRWMRTVKIAVYFQVQWTSRPYKMRGQALEQLAICKNIRKIDDFKEMNVKFFNFPGHTALQVKGI